MSSMLTHSFTRPFVALLILFCSCSNALAQSTPPPGVSCVVSVGNRNAPLAPDGSYTVFGIPGNLVAIRARVTCSDGSVGQSAAGFTNPFQPATIELGPIEFGAITPVPVAISLSAPQRRLTTGQTGQLTVRAVGANGVQTDVTPRNQGTVYAISNDLMATVSDNGLVTIFPLFASASSSRVVASATNLHRARIFVRILLGALLIASGYCSWPSLRASQKIGFGMRSHPQYLERTR